MNHFTLGDWLDFIQNHKGRAATAEMQKHLDDGCRQCRKVVRMWRSLVAFAASERAYSPPNRALRSARGFYGLFKPGKQRASVLATAHLLFDSFFESVPAGIRSSHSPPRQLVYSAGKVVIDLRIERQSGCVYIVGQAQPRSPRDPAAAGREILVLQGTKTLARTISNRFGEFQFTLDSEENTDDAEFSIVLKGPTSFVIPLRDIGLSQREYPES
jgi:hypothetical protein